MLSLQGTWLLWDEQMKANRLNPPVLPALLLLDMRNLQEETLHTQDVHSSAATGQTAITCKLPRARSDQTYFLSPATLQKRLFLPGSALSASLHHQFPAAARLGPGDPLDPPMPLYLLAGKTTCNQCDRRSHGQRNRHLWGNWEWTPLASEHPSSPQSSCIDLRWLKWQILERQKLQDLPLYYGRAGVSSELRL